ncbi:MAG TPA: M20/M25/M40 family metallo-hydrolase [Thermoanaerobaculia bacterium]
MRPPRARPGLVPALLAATVVSTTLFAQPPPSVRAASRDWLAKNERAVLEDLASLLAIPNLASDYENIRTNAEAIRGRLEARGFKVQLLDGEGGPPAIFGELPSRGAKRTLTVYAHYDGQPVDPAKWASPPWTPTLRRGTVEAGAAEIRLDSLPAGRLDPEWRLYARSASDDKAPIIALLAALDALRAQGRKPSVNLEVFFEGEEEAGSDHLEAVLRKNAPMLKSDLWLLCDGPVHQTRRPQLFFGARGVMGLEMTVYGPRRALHSGHYGNWAPNPALLIADLLARMRTPDGRITIEGFYDDVRPPTDAEKRALAAVPDPDPELRRDLWLAATEADNAKSVERIMLPALNVRGIEAGGVGDKAANAIATAARASIDFRLVPDQKPARVREITEAYLTKLGWHVVHEEPTEAVRSSHPRVVRLQWEGGYPAARTDMDRPEARALARALSAGGGPEFLRLPTLGGSVPWYLFDQIVGAPVIGLPIVNHDNNQHAANENLRLANLWEGIEAYAVMLEAIGRELEKK